MNWQDEQKKVATGVTGYVPQMQDGKDFTLTTPQPKREWVGLTDEVKQEWIDAMPYDIEPRHCMNLINVIEVKLKELNT